MKADVAEPAHIGPAVVSMKRLNVAGHANHSSRRRPCLHRYYRLCTVRAWRGNGGKSGVRLRLRLSRIPFLDGAEQYAEDWLFPGGSCKNQRCYQDGVQFARGFRDEMQLLLFTPETSGGLLAAVASDKLAEVSARFAAVGHFCAEIGEVVAGDGIEVLP